MFYVCWFDEINCLTCFWNTPKLFWSDTYGRFLKNQQWSEPVFVICRMEYEAFMWQEKCPWMTCCRWFLVFRCVSSLWYYMYSEFTLKLLKDVCLPLLEGLNEWGRYKLYLCIHKVTASITLFWHSIFLIFNWGQALLSTEVCLLRGERSGVAKITSWREKEGSRAANERPPSSNHWVFLCIREIFMLGFGEHHKKNLVDFHGALKCELWRNQKFFSFWYRLLTRFHPNLTILFNHSALVAMTYTFHIYINWT